MKLKELIPLLFTEDTSSKDRVVRIEMPDPVCKFVYEGRIIDFYNDYIITPARNTNYKGYIQRFGTPIREFDVLQFTHYLDETDPDMAEIPEYNWPINIVVY